MNFTIVGLLIGKYRYEISSKFVQDFAKTARFEVLGAARVDCNVSMCRDGNYNLFFLRMDLGITIRRRIFRTSKKKVLLQQRYHLLYSYYD